MRQRGPAHAEFGRTICVVASDGKLAVALRERVPRAYATVLDVAPGDAAAALAARPWPWMLVGEGSVLTEDAVAAVRGAPVLVVWRGVAPPGLPGHAVCVDGFGELAREVTAGLRRDVAGMHLAPGDGVTMPDGSQRAAAVLEALVARHPGPVYGAAGALRSVERLLAHHGAAVRAAPVAGGGMRLVPRTAP